MLSLKERPKVRNRTFLDRNFPAGAGAKIVTITPNDAAELLAANENNRTLSEATVEKYAADMKAGKWAFNGESIIIADDGQLNDGQHRCQASVIANTAFDAVVVYGVERESRTTVDQGKVRGAGNYLSMEGVANGNNIAALSRMMIAYDRSKGRSINATGRVSNAAIMDYAHAHSAELAEAVTWAAKGSATARHMASRTMFAFWYHLLSELRGGQEYCNRVLFGEGLTSSDPAYRVRDRLAGLGRASRNDRTEVFLRGWCFHRDGKPMQLVKIMGELPAV